MRQHQLVNGERNGRELRGWKGWRGYFLLFYLFFFQEANNYFGVLIVIDSLVDKQCLSSRP